MPARSSGRSDHDKGEQGGGAPAIGQPELDRRRLAWLQLIALAAARLAGLLASSAPPGLPDVGARPHEGNAGQISFGVAVWVGIWRRNSCGGNCLFQLIR